jgi:hypothetical protein
MQYFSDRWSLRDAWRPRRDGQTVVRTILTMFSRAVRALLREPGAQFRQPNVTNLTQEFATRPNSQAVAPSKTVAERRVAGASVPTEMAGNERKRGIKIARDYRRSDTFDRYRVPVRTHALNLWVVRIGLTASTPTRGAWPHPVRAIAERSPFVGFLASLGLMPSANLARPLPTSSVQQTKTQ